MQLNDINEAFIHLFLDTGILAATMEFQENVDLHSLPREAWRSYDQTVLCDPASYVRSYYCKIV